MNRDPDERSQPDGAAPDEFDAIVSALRLEGEVPEWPDDAERAAGLFDPAPSPHEDPPAGTDPAGRPQAGSPRPDTPPTDVPPAGEPPQEPRPSRARRIERNPVHRAPVDPTPDPTFDPAIDPALDDDHFVPPEPPPLPRIGPPALVGLVLIALGLALLLVPGWVVPEPYGLPLGLVGLASGLGWLVLRLWPESPSRGDEDGDDDGAVL